VRALTDEEVITLEICGEYFGFEQDETIYDYFRGHYAHFFPQLRERTLFARQAANLWQVKAMIQQRLTIVSEQAADPIQLIDTMPLPVCVYTRSRRDHCFKPDADYSYTLLPARPHDSQLLDDLLAGFQGVAIADKGFIDAVRQQELAAKRAVKLITPPHKKMKVQLPVRLHRICQRWRKRIETVGSHLTGRFHLLPSVPVTSGITKIA
jgi:hypothetical protein